MIIDKKGITQLQQLKIKGELDEFPLVSNYLYINGYKMIFIVRHSQKVYHVCASSACHFAPLKHEAVFDILYWTEDLNDAISMFKGYVIRSFQELPK